MSTSTVPLSRANFALRHSAIPALRKLTLDESDDAVTISGCVASYYLKQLAQETVMPALAGRTLYNEVSVVPQRRLIADLMAAS